jgi:hypothetical protein
VKYSQRCYSLPMYRSFALMTATRLAARLIVIGVFLMGVCGDISCESNVKTVNEFGVIIVRAAEYAGYYPTGNYLSSARVSCH